MDMVKADFRAKQESLKTEDRRGEAAHDYAKDW